MTQPNDGHLVTSARNATLPDLVTILQTQRARQLDMVLPGSRLTVSAGNLIVPAEATQLNDDGVTSVGGAYRPMKTFDSGLADKLGVPLRWVRWTRENRPDIFDATVNMLLAGGASGETVYPPCDRKFLLRLFRGDLTDTQEGIARAFLSDTYKPIDHLDVLMTALSVINSARAQAVRDALGLPPGCPVTDADIEMAGDLGGLAGGVEIRNLNLTEDSMHLRVTVPGIITAATKLTANYRDPFRENGARRADGYQPPAGRPRAGDIVEAGFDLRNNEIGGGAFEIVPLVRICICDNGQVRQSEALRTVHLGGKLEEGTIEWSDETQRKAKELIMAKTRDAITAFCDQGHLEAMVARMEERADVAVTDPAETIKVVAKKCQFSEDQQTEIMRHFMLGGQATAAGVANAVTSVAQTLTSPEDALDMEYKALTAMETAADYAEAPRP